MLSRFHRFRTPVELLGAAAVVAWRAFARPPLELWRDWAAVLAALWVFSILIDRPKAVQAAALGVAGYLLGLYAWGQVPHTLYTLGVGP